MISALLVWASAAWFHGNEKTGIQCAGGVQILRVTFNPFSKILRRAETFTVLIKLSLWVIGVREQGRYDGCGRLKPQPPTLRVKR